MRDELSICVPSAWDISFVAVYVEPLVFGQPRNESKFGVGVIKTDLTRLCSGNTCGRGDIADTLREGRCVTGFDNSNGSVGGLYTCDPIITR